MTSRDRMAHKVEHQLRQAITTGRLVDLRTGSPEQDDPAQGATWPAARTVRAELLVELLTNADGGRVRAVKLRGARITGFVDLEAATLACPLLLQDCYFDEPINLLEAQAPSARLPGCHLPALHAAGLAVRGNLELNVGFTSYGQVTLRGAHIGGELLFGGATLLNPKGVALDADGLVVDQSLRCHRRFSARGEVYLRSAHIGGVFTCNSAELLKPNGRALWADGLTVKGGAFFMKRFRAEGELRLLGAEISSQLNFLSATLSHPNHDGAMALQLQGVRADELWLLLAEPPKGVVSLINARVGSLYDDPGSWPETVYLSGFIYDRLDNDQVSVRERLRWLCSDPIGYSPQPYGQLVAVHRQAGNEQAARRVAIANQQQRRQVLTPAGKVWNWLLYLTVGYGYRTWLAGVWLAAFLLAGTIVFAVAYAQRLLTAAKPVRELQHFNPLVYTLDVLLPIVNLGQEDGWVPHCWAAVGVWVLTLVGWVLTTAVVAGLTGVLKRD